ncbi:oligosaccharide flippase family protein [Chitinophaga nivalis]|uniref:Polysaccharide biosynthesis C-terminal domain-containing protein n=1 Tax=Chitinophaga nivalis TaxID=2991709 RepID=A0ABT3IUI0_9BACT|nr:polysaccharide biosynthesis C-terminal domain-containing protein [Chitinophaga nivalis]MCW3462759.1 polysaccharide biosynthesis C-terminal domain-containing protein [Chitinophaga nivalis]MCW3487551.1 polysaccharide biosynthesis C-terminal domain-containing protein [Chitinophaga nivalis]
MSIKQLAGQTVYYGLSNIVSKLLNYFLTPFYLGILTRASFGEMSNVYAYIPFANIVLTYGMETAFFRFAKKENKAHVLGTSTISLLISTISITILLLLLREPVIDSYAGKLAGLNGHPAFYTYVVFLMAFDALTAIPFAQLRLEGRPVRYAVIRIAGIVTTIFFNVFFLVICPKLYASGHHWVPDLQSGSDQTGYIYLSNMLGSAVTLLLFLPQIRNIEWRFDAALWKKMVHYALPLIVVGMAGMVNETFDRAWFLPQFLPGNNMEAKKEVIALYSANYKLAILITMFIQAFRLGAEPFFFKQAESGNPQKMYARIMKLFVIMLCFMFLFVSLYLSIWKIFLRVPFYYEGMRIVPVLLLANMFLGIYYNLTIWFKLTDRTRTGAIITIITAFLAFLLNWWWIPVMGYYGAALATMVCYFIQMVICYVLGQKYYPVPYHLPKLITYIGLAVIIYYVFNWLNANLLSPKDIYALKPLPFAVATLLFAAYGWFIFRMEKKEFARLPVIGKFIR